MYDITALGELLIDFTPDGENSEGMPRFATNPGGAPANVLAMSARLGGQCAFLGKVGRDDFGEMLRHTLEECDIDCQGLVMSPEYPTTLAFVHLDETGDRSFSFYRKNCADTMYYTSELNQSVIRDTHIFHFGSVSLTDDPVRTTTMTAAELARQQGAVISFDPNYRPFLWSSEKMAIQEITRALPLADILKVSEDESVMLTGQDDPAKAAEWFHEQGLSLVFITRGGDGAFFSNGTVQGNVDSFNVRTIDTTGAGDTFFGTLLTQLKDMTLEEMKALTAEQLITITRYANAAAALTTTKPGAIPAMPQSQDIEQLLS